MLCHGTNGVQQSMNTPHLLNERLCAGLLRPCPNDLALPPFVMRPDEKSHLPSRQVALSVSIVAHQRYPGVGSALDAGLCLSAYCGPLLMVQWPLDSAMPTTLPS
jgi:hypothetical protein